MQTAQAPDYKTQLTRASAILTRLKQEAANSQDLAWTSPMMMSEEERKKHPQGGDGVHRDWIDAVGSAPTYGAPIAHWQHIVEILQALCEEPPLIAQYEPEVEQAQAIFDESDQALSQRRAEHAGVKLAYRQAIEGGDIETACLLHSRLSVYGDVLKYLEAQCAERKALLLSREQALTDARTKLVLARSEYAELDWSEMDFWETDQEKGEQQG